MDYLVYGIVRESDLRSSPLPGGLGGQPVLLVVEGGLAAAISGVPEVDAVPEVPRLLAYAQVIEGLSRWGPILPMRYGCLLDSEEQVRELLRRRWLVFQQALEELRGCVEMGLRILLEEPPPAAVSLESKGESQARGATYLAERRAHYAKQDDLCGEADGAAEQFRSAFAGLYTKCHAERPAGPQEQLLSLNFLVRREDVTRFREAFARLQQTTWSKVLLTGPWPPYNFVP
jgi:hypothetical protein